MLQKVFIKQNPYFDTYYIKDTEKDQYVGIIECHCRHVAERYFIGWKFPNNHFIPSVSLGKTAMFDTYEEALNYIQEPFE